MAKAYEYSEDVQKILETESFNVLDHMNRLGAQGYRIIGRPSTGMEEANITALGGRKMHRMVISFLIEKEYEIDDAVSAEAEVPAPIILREAA